MLFKKLFCLTIIVSLVLLANICFATFIDCNGRDIRECLPKSPPPAEALKKADAVFYGKVASVDETRGVAKFEVERIWKGPIKETIFLYYPNVDEIFMARFFNESDVGKKYLVYAHKPDKDPNKLTAIISNLYYPGKTHLVLNPEKDEALKELGSWISPQQTSSLVLLLSVLLLGGLMITVFVFRKRKLKKFSKQ